MLQHAAVYLDVTRRALELAFTSEVNEDTVETVLKAHPDVKDIEYKKRRTLLKEINDRIRLGRRARRAIPDPALQWVVFQALHTWQEGAGRFFPTVTASDRDDLLQAGKGTTETLTLPRLALERCHTAKRNERLGSTNLLDSNTTAEDWRSLGQSDQHIGPSLTVAIYTAGQDGSVVLVEPGEARG